MKKSDGRPLESATQSKIIKRLQADGWICIRLIQTNCNGIPDLLCLKDGQVRFIEVKRAGEQPRPLQEYRHKQLLQAGFAVDVMNETSIQDETADSEKNGRHGHGLQRCDNSDNTDK